MIKIIDFEAVRKISVNTCPSDYYEWINDCLINKSTYQMPVKSRISQINGDYYAIMPCLYEKGNTALVKMIGRHTPNFSGGKPHSTMMGDMLLYEGNTGILKAVMDAEYITTIRTGAAAAHSAILYGKKEFRTIGLIGLGNIMTACMQVLLSKISNRELVIKLYRHHGQEERFQKKI